MCLKGADGMQNGVDSDKTAQQEQSDLGLRRPIFPMQSMFMVICNMWKIMCSVINCRRFRNVKVKAK